MHLFRALAFLLIAAIPAASQAPRAVTLAHITLNSANPDAAIAFWKDVIGTSGDNRGALRGVSTLGARIVFAQQAPSGPSAGSVIDHLGFHVPDIQPFIDKLAKTTYKSSRPVPNGEVLIIEGPDGVRIELTEDNSMYPPIEFSHIHFSTPEPEKMQAWYTEHFGARPNPDDTHASRLGATALMFAKADAAAPLAGRAIDHLTLEVKDLKTFSDAGIKLDPSGFLTDPWGTRIELIEASSH